MLCATLQRVSLCVRLVSCDCLGAEGVVMVWFGLVR